MGTLGMLLVAWGGVTVILICALIYRSTLETREEDQLFLDSAQDITASEQRVIVSRIRMLSTPIVALWVLSGALLAVVAGMWLYQGYQSF
ncbi:MAG TPA: hypothetical protein VMD78_06560 [Candidatus Baltobacteraceae bacterium]|nr:hypothetical protein [Candidatus Baltobacteraceae bacterium]